MYMVCVCVFVVHVVLVGVKGVCWWMHACVIFAQPAYTTVFHFTRNITNTVNQQSFTPHQLLQGACACGVRGGWCGWRGAH